MIIVKVVWDVYPTEEVNVKQNVLITLAKEISPLSYAVRHFKMTNRVGLR